MGGECCAPAPDYAFCVALSRSTSLSTGNVVEPGIIDFDTSVACLAQGFYELLKLNFSCPLQLPGEFVATALLFAAHLQNVVTEFAFDRAHQRADFGAFNGRAEFWHIIAHESFAQFATASPAAVSVEMARAKSAKDSPACSASKAALASSSCSSKI